MLAKVINGKIIPQYSLSSLSGTRSVLLSLGGTRMVRRSKILGQADTTPTTITPAQAWVQLNIKCMEMLKSESACRGLLGTQPLYFAPEARPSIPTWAWLVLGVAAGFSVAKLVGESKD